MHLLSRPILWLMFALLASPWVQAGTPVALDSSSKRIGFELEPSGKLVSPIGQEVDLKPSRPYTRLEAKYVETDQAWRISLSNRSGDQAVIRYSIRDFGLRVSETGKGRTPVEHELRADPKLIDTLQIWSANAEWIPTQGRIAELRDQGRSLAILELPSRKVLSQTTIDVPEGVRLTLASGRYLIATSADPKAFSGGDRYSGVGTGPQLLADLDNFLLEDSKPVEHCSWAIVGNRYVQSATPASLSTLVRDFFSAKKALP